MLRVTFTTSRGRSRISPARRVPVDRIVTPRFTRDVDELRTWSMDIRSILADNALRDSLAEADQAFLATADAGIVRDVAVGPPGIVFGSPHMPRD